MTRKICIVVASRANYGRIKYVMKAIQEHPDLELQLIVSASTLLYRFGRAVDIIRQDGFDPVKELYYLLEGDNLVTQAKSTGIGTTELATAFHDLKPDMALTVADRFETMATAIAATYLNIPLAHVQGGEVSGNIDDRVRHAITKLSDYHFPATELSRERLIRMGERKERTKNFGCPAMDLLVNEDLSISDKIMDGYGGTGVRIDWTAPYILIVQHPVTSSYGCGFDEMMETLEAAREFGAYQKVVLWPNVDAGTDDVAKAIRVFRERHRELPFHYFRNFSPEDCGRVLNNASCLLGNSSSFIREGGFLGVPAVVVGHRQRRREEADNVMRAGHDRHEIAKAVAQQLDKGRFPKSNLFGDGTAGERIASYLAGVELSNHKSLTY